MHDVHVDIASKIHNAHVDIASKIHNAHVDIASTIHIINMYMDCVNTIYLRTFKQVKLDQ